jgi:DNA-binding transcriptional LysR family regulator
VLIARETHPLIGRRRVEIAAIAEYPWIVLAHDHVGTGRLGSFFAANGLEPPRAVIETTSHSNLLALLREDDFIATIPSPLLPRVEEMGLRRLGVRGTFWDGPAGIAYRRSQLPVTAVNTFCAMVRESFAPWRIGASGSVQSP